MKPSDAFAALEPTKAAFAHAVIGRLATVDAVCSVTFTGSFVEKLGLAGISDIDVVVIVDELTQANFTACKSAVASVDPSTLDLPDHRLVINDTFGPLKFDEAGIVVVHLMIYDRVGHRDHVLKSPFTCYDWERSPYYAGVSLRRLYPVLGLQPRHFLNARRSLNNYLEDIAAGSISYRELLFTGAGAQEVTRTLPLDRRHQGEYAYHIVRNLITNYAKLIARRNRRLADADLESFWKQNLPACAGFLDWFRALTAIKQARQADFPADTTAQTRDFLHAFSGELERAWNQQAHRRLFIRHARTAQNDGSFLGQRRDPAILAAPPALEQVAAHVHSSPALRCRETAAALFPRSQILVDQRLAEIDYGDAEGWKLDDLLLRAPEIPAAWARGEDPPFPGGENTTVVADRLARFCRDLDRNSSVAVTHNVVLRCAVGGALGLPMAVWHRLPIAHLDAFSLLQADGVLYADLSPEQTARLSDALVGHLS